MPSDIYTLSLHDALPICFPSQMGTGGIARAGQTRRFWRYWFGCIKTGEQALTSRLARHAHEGDKIIGSCARDARSEERRVGKECGGVDGRDGSKSDRMQS